MDHRGQPRIAYSSYTNPSANIVISWLDLNHDGRNRIHMTVTGFILMRMAVTEIRGLHVLYLHPEG